MVTFEIYPCGLTRLRKLMNIDFKGQEQYDALKVLGGGEENLILGAEEICV